MKIAKNAMMMAAMLSAVALTGTVYPVFAEDEVVYGRRLMTDEEIAEHRAMMRSLRTPEEREAYRLQHHQEMQARARERGLTLPDQPMPMGQGMGMGMGMGMGPGRGMQQQKQQQSPNTQ